MPDFIFPPLLPVEYFLASSLASQKDEAPRTCEILLPDLYGLNVCVHPSSTRFMSESLPPSFSPGDSIWRCGLWEVIRFRFSHKALVLMMGLVPL